jgi:hypothetical protein
MDQDQIISIVNRAGVPYDKPVTCQAAPRYFVRFFHDATKRSLNLGYSSHQGTFIADFVFKGKTRTENEADCEAFLRLFGGATGNRDTRFASIQPGFSNEAWLIRVIQGYWAIGQPEPRAASSPA